MSDSLSNSYDPTKNWGTVEWAAKHHDNYPVTKRICTNCKKIIGHPLQYCHECPSELKVFKGTYIEMAEKYPGFVFAHY
jgi:hypothetical protein